MNVKPKREATVATHYLRYSTANLLVLLAGFISFPVMTRLLDNTQYGILGYFDTWVMMIVAVTKLGAQHAIIRFYPFDSSPEKMEKFSTNFFLMPLLASMSLWAIGIMAFSGVSWFGKITFSPVLWCAILAIPLMVFASLVEMILRASERSGLLMVTRVSWRWLELLAMLGAVLLLEKTALAAYGGKVVAAVLVAAFYLRWVRINLKFSRAAVDRGEFLTVLRYGMPLVISEIAAVALVSIDRIMLKEMLGDFASVGVYTIGYSLAMQVSVFMHATLIDSFVPVANRIHDTQGAERLRALKGRILLPMTYASIGISVALWSVGSDALQAISGKDKAGSGPVFAWIGTMYALSPLLDISGFGLLLKKRSMTILWLTLCAAALNIALNLYMIPAYGLMGSVYATAIAYAMIGVATCILCPRELLRFPDARTFLTAVSAAAAFLVAVWATDLFGYSTPWPRLFTAGGLWVLLYLLPVLSLDGRLRHLLFNWRKEVSNEEVDNELP